MEYYYVRMCVHLSWTQLSTFSLIFIEIFSKEINWLTTFDLVSSVWKEICTRTIRYVLMLQQQEHEYMSNCSQKVIAVLNVFYVCLFGIDPKMFLPNKES